MTNPVISPQHVLGGIAFEARAIFAGVDSHAAGSPINIEALKGAIARMQGLADLIANPKVATSAVEKVSVKPKRQRRAPSKQAA